MTVFSHKSKNRNKVIFLLLCFCISIYADYAFALSQDTTKSILIQKDKRSDYEKLLGGEEQKQYNYDRVYLPGGDSLPQFTPEQDSLYYRAMRVKIPQFTRFAMELQETTNENAFIEAVAKTPWSIAMQNLAAIPASAYAPDPVDVTNHLNSIRQSLYVPLVPTYMSSGLQVSLTTIGQFLGLLEDVSPTIAYRIDAPSEVEVVVYSIQAYVVQTIFKGNQTSGLHSFTWNLRNDKGKLMPPGDYIIEARIGKYRIQRKRTVI